MDTTYSSHPSANGSDKSGTTTGGTASAAAAAAKSDAKSMYNDAKGAAKRTAESLRAELGNLKTDLDTLMSRAPSLSDEELSEAHAQLMSKVSSMRYAAKGMASQASRQINRGVETTTEYVKDRPMQSVAVAVGTGLLLGMLFKRR